MRDRYASLREGLVGAWIPSVRGDGLLLPDLSGQGNHGTLTNMGPEDWVSGQYGRALDFDGSNEYVSTALELDGLTAFAISAWVYITSFTNDSAIVGDWQNPSQQILLYCDVGDGAVGYRIIFRDTANASFSTSVNASGATLNTWQHVVATYDGTDLKIYSDTVLRDSTAVAGKTLQAGSSSIGIASDSASISARNLIGRLDDIRIYNRALSESEIKLIASRPGIGLRPQRRSMYYAPPTGARRRRILTSML